MLAQVMLHTVRIRLSKADFDILPFFFLTYLVFWFISSCTVDAKYCHNLKLKISVLVFSQFHTFHIVIYFSKQVIYDAKFVYIRSKKKFKLITLALIHYFGLSVSFRCFWNHQMSSFEFKLHLCLYLRVYLQSQCLFVLDVEIQTAALGLHSPNCSKSRHK